MPSSKEFSLDGSSRLADPELVETQRTPTEPDPTRPAVLGIFAAWRLQAYGCAVAVLYAVLLLHLYHDGVWLVDGNGVPVYIDFTCAYVAGLQVLHGQIGSLFDPAEFLKVQTAFVGLGVLYTTWQYPPTYFLVLAPLALLPYAAAFLTWNTATLLGCMAAVYAIVPRLPAIALVLASPFTVWNFWAGQNGFLTASLFGAALLFLERYPVIAGVFVGSLTYKPQFGVLFPIALAASRQWRAFASAAAAIILLAGMSAAAFGPEVWALFPRELTGFTIGALDADAQTHTRDYWGLIQTVYGLVRYLGGSAALAWFAQGLTTVGLAALVWLVWRSRAHYPLKAATLSAAALIATPYAFAYDMAAIAIPVAFLAQDQMRDGLRRGEQTVLLMLFAASFVVFATLGRTPLGPVIVLALLYLILRRIRGSVQQSDGPGLAKNF
jgi:arabinofuranan 3-O-arabinosyltransferase